MTPRILPILRDRQSNGVNSPCGGGLSSPRVGSPHVGSPHVGSSLNSPRDANGRKPPIPTRRNLRQSSSKISISTPTGQDCCSPGGAVSPAPSDAKSSPGPSNPPPDSAKNVKVLIRTRPQNERETGLTGEGCSLQQRGAGGLQLAVEGRSYSFEFDDVLGNDGSQEEIFQLVGQPMVSNVMQGYNACCLAYGQTGAGKTHTMQGELAAGPAGEPNPLRGLAPRVFEEVFEAVKSKEGEAAGAQLQYTCRCSFLQIYNEQVSDLLKPGEKALTLRHDSSRGVFAEHLSEHVVVNVEDAMHLMLTGASNRAIGETKMNRQSSRSHSVFSMRVECRTTTESGISHVRFGTLHLVDLAGSERVKQSGATGAALNEAAEINVSLLTLGRVISKVVEAQQSKLGAHIPYRDSKLTFLLQDSLGGNAKTILIANVSPSAACAHETLSTLQFADGAKCIRNRARVNTDTQGDDRALRAEVERLRSELTAIQDGTTEPLRIETDELQVRLEKATAALREATAKADCITKEQEQLQYKLTRLDEKLTDKDKDLVGLEERYAALSTSSEADIKAAQSAVNKAQEELAVIHEEHKNVVVDAAAAREASVATARTERNGALKELKDKHAAEKARVKEESDKRLAEAGGRHAQELAGQNKQVTRAQAEAASAAASAQGKLSSELQKHVAEMARVKEAAEKQIASASEKHASELAATKKGLQKRLATAKRESKQLSKQQPVNANAKLSELQHMLDVKVAEGCYHEVEIKAVKHEAEKLRKELQECQEKAEAEEARLAAVKSKHAEQLERLATELNAVKGDWERLSKMESEIKAGELEAVVEAAVLAAEARVREEEAARREELLTQIAEAHHEDVEQNHREAAAQLLELRREMDCVKEEIEGGNTLLDDAHAIDRELAADLAATAVPSDSVNTQLLQIRSLVAPSRTISRLDTCMLLALIVSVVALAIAVNTGRQWGQQQSMAGC